MKIHKMADELIAAWRTGGLRSEMNNEKALWGAVLQLAVQDALCVGPSYDRPEWMQRDSLAWMRSDNEAPGSLNFICGALGIDAATVRERVAALTEEGSDGDARGSMLASGARRFA